MFGKINSRFGSIFISAAYEYILVFNLKIHSELFSLFHDKETNSILHGVSQNIYKALFLIWVFVAILTNFVKKLYTIQIKRKMNQIHVYTIQHLNHRELIQEEKFSLTLGSIFGIPFTLTFALLFSLANRTLL